MRFMWVFCVIFGCLLAVYAFNYDTTVLTANGMRVHNIGLMNDRQNLLILAVCALVVGALLAILAKLPQRSDTTKEAGGSQADADSDMAPFYSGERNLGSGPYKLYLVTKFEISKNETLGQFVVCGQLFDSLEEGLVFADKKDREYETRMKDEQSKRTGTLGHRNLRFTINPDESVVVRAGGAWSKTYPSLDAAIEAEGPLNK